MADIDTKYKSEYSGQEIDEVIAEFNKITATPEELNKLHGLNTNLTVDTFNKLYGLNIDADQLNLLSNVTSDVQEQLDSKKNISELKGIGSATKPVYFDDNGNALVCTGIDSSISVAEAIKATNDGDGKEISKTYLKNDAKDRVLDTLEVGGWTNNKYTALNNKYLPENWALTIELAPTADIDDLKAFRKAGLTGSITDNIITAIGTVPNRDIPIIVNRTRLAD